MPTWYVWPSSVARGVAVAGSHTITCVSLEPAKRDGLHERGQTSSINHHVCMSAGTEGRQEGAFGATQEGTLGGMQGGAWRVGGDG